MCGSRRKHFPGRKLLSRHGGIARWERVYRFDNVTENDISTFELGVL